MKSFTVKQLLDAVGGQYFGSEDALSREISFVTTDSRNAEDGALFIALPGSRVDGHDFMAQVLEKGAAVCLSQREPKGDDETPCVVVADTLRAAGKLAGWYRTLFDIPVVGITGSVGKTTAKEMIASVLSQGYNTHKTQKNFNNELGVPQTMLQMDKAHTAAVIEMGISDFGEMSRLTKMVRPTVAVMTIIGYSHLEFLKDREGVLRAKSEIFESMDESGLAIVSGDDDLLKAFDPGIPKKTYGLTDDNDYWADGIENLNEGGIRCVLHYRDISLPVHIPAYGAHMVYAALAGCAVGDALGLCPEQIASGIAAYETVGRRARLIGTDSLTVIDDCYNANPSSVSAALDSLSLLSGRKVCILGDMLELGENSAKLHQNVGEKTVKIGAALVLCVGEMSENTVAAAQNAGGTAIHFVDKAELIARLPKLLQKGDRVLVKASHSMGFEEVTEALEKLVL